MGRDFIRLGENQHQMLFSQKAAARELGVSRYMIDQLVKSADLDTRDIGKMRLITRCSLDRVRRKLYGESSPRSPAS